MSFTESVEKLIEQDRSGLLGIHSSWERVRLGDVASILNGFAFPSARFTRDEGTPLIRIRDIADSTTEARFSGSFEEQYLVDIGDLLVGMDGDFNCALWRGPKALLNQRVCKITPDERLLGKRFLLSALPAYLKAINDATSSITVKHLSSRTLGDLTLPFPPRAEQERIADEVEKQFTRLGASVAALQRVKANLKRYRASVLKAACEGSLVPTEAELARREGRSFESGEELLKRILKERRARWEADQLAKIKAAGQRNQASAADWRYPEPVASEEESLGVLPDGWAWANWSQLSRRVTVGHVGPMKDEYVSGGVPFLRSQNVRPNRFAFEGLLHISHAFHARLAKSKLRPGDVVVVRSGSVGVSCVVPEALGEANCSDLVVIQQPVVFLPQFGCFYMNSAAQSRVRKGQVGVALTHFNTASVASLPVPLPPLPEQHRIVAEVERRLSVVDELVATVEKNLARCARLRQSILKMAFEGRLVPQDPNDEPATLLLERIRSTRAAGAVSSTSPSTGRPRGRRRAKNQ